MMVRDLEGPESMHKLPKGWGHRHTLTLLGFTGFALSYVMRFSISIAIVAMVNRTESAVGKSSAGFKNTETDIMCPLPSNDGQANWTDNNGTSYGKSGQTQQITEDLHGQFNWSEYDQGIILGSFFWGYIVMQMPGGWLSQRFGGKWIYGLGLFITGILSFISPFAANMGSRVFIFIRVVQGLAEGVTVPSMHCILSKWVPPTERGKLTGITYAGIPFGSAISMLGSGYIVYFLSWPWVFYISGLLTTIWFILWGFLVHSSPQQDPRISEEELGYLNDAISGIEADKDKNEDLCQSFPWREVSKSVPFWALFVAFVTETWGLYTLMSELPTYFRTAMHFNIRENSWLSAIPSLLAWAVSITVNLIGDFLIDKGLLSIEAARKTCNSIGLWGSAGALVGVAYTGCDRLVTVSLMTTAVALRGALYGGIFPNVLDIAPNYAGILMGFFTMASSVPGIVAPWATGLIIDGNPSLERWRIVFLITAIISFVGNLVFVCFGSGEEQAWNKPKDKGKESRKCSTAFEISPDVFTTVSFPSKDN